MARIPIVRERGVRTRGLSAGGLSPSAPQGAFGIDISQPAGELTQVANRAREQADRLATMEADSALTEWENDYLYSPENGALNRQGRNAFGLPEETQQAFEQRTQEIKQGLTSERQRQAFEQAAQNRWGNISSTVNRYVSSQAQQYAQTQTAEYITRSRRAAALHFNDPDRVQQEIQRQNEALFTQAEREGWSPEQLANSREEMVSANHRSVIEQYMAKDPGRALTEYAKRSSELSMDDRAALQPAVHEVEFRRQADQVVSSITGTGTVGGEGIWSRLIQQESGGRQLGSNGQPITSSAGAVGIAQIMPETGPEAAELAGLEWDEERFRTDAEYNEALGRAYFGRQMEEFGDPMLAAAAYNAGPGNVKKWLRDIGDPRQGEITAAEFAERIPFEETRNYVANVAPPGMDEPQELSRSQQMAMVNQLPAQLREHVKPRLEEIHAQQDQAMNELYEQAYDVAAQAQNVDAVPPEVWTRLPSDDQMKMRSQMEKLRSGEQVQTDYEFEERLARMSAQELAKLSPARDMRPNLDDAAYNRWFTAWQEARQGRDGALSTEKEFKRYRDDALSLAGILTGTSEDAREPENVRRRQLFDQALERQVAIYRQQHDGRDPSTQEYRDMANRLTMEVSFEGESSGLPGWVFGTSFDNRPEAPLFEVPEGADVRWEGDWDDIPEFDRRQIRQAIETQGIPFTEDYAVRLYGQRVGLRTR